jgi:hypothetical protein
LETDGTNFNPTNSHDKNIAGKIVAYSRNSHTILYGEEIPGT